VEGGPRRGGGIATARQVSLAGILDKLPFMWRQFWLPVTRMAGGVVCGVAVLVFGCQSRLMYFPRAHTSKEVDAFIRAGGKRIEFETSCGRQVAFYLGPRAAESGATGPGPSSRHVWMVCGGNGSLGLDWWPIVSDWNPSIGWLFLDYPGYGSCEGKPNPDHIRESSIAAVTALAAHLGTTPEELSPGLGVLGHSLGCAAALMAADTLAVRRIVLIAPFTTMTDMAKRVVGRPLCWLNRHRYNNLANLDAVASRAKPVHIFHGTRDEVIPCAMGRELSARHPESTVFHEIRGATHMTVIDEAQSEIGAVIDDLCER
jgi:pimeloyl-ACP methyl ester carboxylesterase